MKEKEIIKHLLKLQDKLQHYADFLTCDHEQAKDLLQDTNLKTLEHLEKFERDTNFQTWTFTIMYHLFINNLKKCSRVFFTPDMETVVKNHRGDAESDPIEKYDIEDLLNYRMSLLSAEDRKIWWMYYLGFQYEEIARRMHFPVGTIKSRIHSIRMKLRRGGRDGFDLIS